MECKYCNEPISMFNFFISRTCFACSLVESRVDKEVRKELNINYCDWFKESKKKIPIIKKKLKEKYKNMKEE